MNDDYEYFTLYHGTSSNHMDSIQRNGLDPNRGNYRSDHWLGQGVYYFDNIELATWWAGNAVRLNRKNYPYLKKLSKVVYQSNVKVKKTQILNLDTVEGNIKLKSYYIEMLRNMEKQNKSFNFKDNQLLCILCDSYKEDKNISLIIRTFTKQNASYIPTMQHFDIYNKEISLLKLPFFEKQFCVSKKNCIENTIQIQNE